MSAIFSTNLKNHKKYLRQWKATNAKLNSQLKSVFGYV